MNLIVEHARPYVNYGRWVADCPARCGSARKMEPGESVYHCNECLHVTPVDWPDSADDIWDELQRRPSPKNRNWYPSGHELALRAGIPHGQSVKELRQETEANREG